MAKMNKEQSAKFDKLFDTTMNWGDGENCNGLFVGILPSDVDHESHELYYLTTCVQECDGQIEILSFDGSGYYDLLGYIPLNRKTKSTMKNVVACLLGGGTMDDVQNML